MAEFAGTRWLTRHPCLGAFVVIRRSAFSPEPLNMALQAAFPATRMRRLRRHDWTRRLVAESTLSPADFIWPLFVVDGEKRREPVASMPGVDRLSVDFVVGAAEEAANSASPSSHCFPIPTRP